MVKTLLLLLFFVVFFGCSQVQQRQSVSPEIIYKYDLPIKIDNIQYQGVALVPSGRNKMITVNPPSGFNYIGITSCHRDHQLEKQGNEFTYRYDAINGIENVGSCPVIITAIRKSDASIYKAFIDFSNIENHVVGSVSCNGVQRWYKGVSTCQTKMGLVIRLRFNQNMLTDPDCNIVKINPRQFEISTQKDSCVYMFKAKGEDKWFRLTTIGYEEVILRQ